MKSDKLKFDRKSFGERLKHLREEKGCTQQDLANQLGISRNTISGYETGARIPDLDTLAMLCDVFQVTADYLLCFSDEKGDTDYIAISPPGKKIHVNKIIKLMEYIKDLEE